MTKQMLPKQTCHGLLIITIFYGATSNADIIINIQILKQRYEYDSYLVILLCYDTASTDEWLRILTTKTRIQKYSLLIRLFCDAVSVTDIPVVTTRYIISSQFSASDHVTGYPDSCPGMTARLSCICVIFSVCVGEFRDMRISRKVLRCEVERGKQEHMDP